eukprot:GGOE01056525.1.p3 GENE.GGOE01056525.1~~GGOE01056525.1.p3  ORF type:complete len:127 (+),score=0.93 GGOE01056525.1:520-900(+)
MPCDGSPAVLHRAPLASPMGTPATLNASGKSGAPTYTTTDPFCLALLSSTAIPPSAFPAGLGSAQAPASLPHRWGRPPFPKPWGCPRLFSHFFLACFAPYAIALWPAIGGLIAALIAPAQNVDRVL